VLPDRGQHYFGVAAGAELFDELSAGVGVACVGVSGVVPGVVLGVALLSDAPAAGAVAGAALPVSPVVPLEPEVGVAGVAAVVSVLVVSCLLQPARAAVVTTAARTNLLSEEMVVMADPFLSLTVVA
jgi:hypothetical protein